MSEVATSPVSRVRARQIKDLRFVKTVLASESYTEAAKTLIPNSKYPRGAVSNRMQDSGKQAILKRLVATEESKLTLARQDILDKCDNIHEQAMQSGQLGAATPPIVLKAKVQGLLIDQVQHTVKPLSTKDLAHLTDEQIEAAYLERLNGEKGQQG